MEESGESDDKEEDASTSDKAVDERENTADVEASSALASQTRVKGFLAENLESFQIIILIINILC